jgi:hypothetical protein
VIDGENLFVQGDAEQGCRITDRRFNEKFRIKSKKDDPANPPSIRILKEDSLKKALWFTGGEGITLVDLEERKKKTFDEFWVPEAAGKPLTPLVVDYSSKTKTIVGMSRDTEDVAYFHVLNTRNKDFKTSQCIKSWSTGTPI